MDPGTTGTPEPLAAFATVSTYVAPTSSGSAGHINARRPPSATMTRVVTTPAGPVRTSVSGVNVEMASASENRRARDTGGAMSVAPFDGCDPAIIAGTATSGPDAV